ncbi:hypothetical protein [Candidatus Chloroploca sp. Khr17]|uniref:hypothetical protein n=1 Tax=Candidatus Chloroploca sp. Khr17 TaxID=2496869 RepID=UPI00101D8756|nr:hypothetical protein [Candidatus Chloroploca sp. Khr17]
MMRSPRFWLACGIGIIAGLLVNVVHPNFDQALTDIGWAFQAARDLVANRDPYRHPVSPHLVPYPLTAAIVVMPWALLPDNLGIMLFFGGGSALLAYGLLRDGQYWRLIVFVSPAYVMALKSIQWSPLLMAVFFFPMLAPLLLAKPTLALPIALTMRWNRYAIIGTAAIVGLSLLVMPDWPVRWITQTGQYQGFVPVFTWAGPLLLTSLFFWRNRQARLFFLLTITPQHYFFYDQLLLWMIPQTRRQMIVLTLTAWSGFLYVWQTHPTLWTSRPYLLGFIYLPALLIVLWQQARVQQGIAVVLMRMRR